MAIFKDGIPATVFFVDDINSEFGKLREAGVSFITEPVDAEGVSIAVFDDTCGNLIQLARQND